MFGLSFWEIAVILVIALIFLGPEKLPGLLRSIGRGMNELRRASADLRNVVEEPLHEVRQPLEELRSGLQDSVDVARRQIESEAQRAAADEPSLSRPVIDSETNGTAPSTDDPPLVAPPDRSALAAAPGAAPPETEETPTSPPPLPGAKRDS